MTNEEKAKAYEEMVQRVKELHETGNFLTKKQMEIICPELADSEDERTRKYLIEELKAAKSVGELKFVIPQPTKEECIAYLEKQKEQKHPDGCFTCDEYKKGYEEGRRNGFTAGYNKAIKEVEQKEQKPVDDPLDDPKFLKGFDTGRDVQRIFDEQKPWKVGANAYFTPEQKPTEWSEEDKEMFRVISNRIEKFNEWATEKGYPIDDPTMKQSPIAWLKSFLPQPQQNMSIGFMLYLDEHRPDGKMCLSNAECNEIEAAFKNQSWDTILRYVEKYQPQKLEEWTEEDEKVYNNALDALYYKDSNNKDDVLSALKDLCDLISKKRKVIPPYSRWKPSKVQKEALQRAIDCLDSEYRDHPEELDSLLEDLVKLM